MKSLLFLISLVSIALAGCSASSAPSSEASHEGLSKPSIVTSFYPLYFMAERIAGSNAEVINAAGSMDVHEYEPSPKDMVRFYEADLVIYQGAELEPWTNGVILELEKKGIATVEISRGLDLAKREEHADEKHDEHTEDHHEDDHHGHEDEHHDEHEKHENEHAEDHHDHHHGEFDPHTWLDPVHAQRMVDTIATAIAEVDPVHAESYLANAAELKNEFASLDESFTAVLSSCAGNEVIVAHDAYGYLARRYGFTAHAISGLSTQDVPSAKILAQLKEEASGGISHILIEENAVRAFAQTLAAETGLAVLPVNPLGRGTLDDSKDFLGVMNMNLESFATALNCK